MDLLFAKFFRLESMKSNTWNLSNSYFSIINFTNPYMNISHGYHTLQSINSQTALLDTVDISPMPNLHSVHTLPLKLRRSLNKYKSQQCQDSNTEYLRDKTS